MWALLDSRWPNVDGAINIHGGAVKRALKWRQWEIAGSGKIENEFRGANEITTLFIAVTDVFTCAKFAVVEAFSASYHAMPERRLFIGVALKFNLASAGLI